MDKSKFYHPNQEFRLGDGILKTNVYNGRIIYNYPLTSIGAGNFKIDANLVYNSFYNINDFYDRKLGFGNGWKYSFEEFLFKYKSEYNLEGYNLLDYVYIDNEWCLHRFVKYKQCEGYDNAGTIYYDTSGTGLKLIIRPNSNYQIIDEYGNVSVYNRSSGKLISFISGVNSQIMKNFEYDNEEKYIISAYDSRKSDRKIKFTYDSNDLPLKVYSTTSQIYYTFEHDGIKLVKIKENNAKKSKLIQEFIYNDSQLEYIVNSKNLQSIMLEYLSKNSNKVINKIIVGTLSEEVITKDDNSEIYMGEDGYLGEASYLTNCGKQYHSSKIFMNKDKICEMFIYKIMDSYTEIQNIKGIKKRVYFDIDGRKISKMEYNDEDDSKIHNYTSEKPKGWSIEIEGNNNVYINDKQSREIYINNKKYEVNIPNSSLNHFLNLFNNDEESLSEHFVLSFWLMFDITNDSNLLSTLKYTLNSEVIESKVILNNTLGGSWQYVSIPLNLVGDQKTLKNLSIIIEQDNSLEVLNDKIFIADVRIKKGSNQTICIDNLKNDDKTYKELKIGSNLYFYNNGEEKVETLNPKFYLTEDDIIATYRSLYYSKKNNDLYFEMYYCNKTKIMSVTYISMLPFYLTDDETIRNEHKFYDFDFAEYDSNGVKIDSDTPNYHFRYIDLYAKNEESKSYRVTEIQRKIKQRGNNRYYYECNTLIGIAGENGKVSRLDEKNSVCNVFEVNDDGTERKKEYIKRNYNSNNELEKEIRIIWENHLDEYGNITKVVNKAIDSDTEEITKEYTFEEVLPINREFIHEIKENGKISTFSYNQDGTVDYVLNKIMKKYEDGYVENVDILINKIKYAYDDFKKLINVKFYNENEKIIYENNLSYDIKGNVSLLKDKSGLKYAFIYDAFSRLCEVYSNNKLIHKQYVEHSKEFDIHNSMTYKNNNICATIDVIDKHNRILTSSVKESNGIEEKIIFNYEDEEMNFSKSLSRIKEIFDPFTNIDFKYEYDDSVEEGTTTKINVGNNYTIEIKANGTKIYDIKDDVNKYKFNFETEDQLNVNPKSCYNFYKKNTSEDWEEIKSISYDYEYDNLSRLSCKKSKKYNSSNVLMQNIKNIEYYESSNLPKNIKYTINAILDNGEGQERNSEIIFNNSYMNGNITKIIETGNRFLDECCQNTDIINTKIKKYYYDSSNRIIKEENSDNGFIEYNYGENSGMLESIVKNNTVVKTLTYNAGRLTNFLENDKMSFVQYDDYGNIIKMGDISLGYNSRNLMSNYSDLLGDYSFEYNYQGHRTKKIKNNIYEINYYLDDAKILGEDMIDISTKKIIKKFRYLYDENGICAINYIKDGKDNIYNLVRDSIGNISKVVYNGKLIGEYTYDAWGNCDEIIFTDSNPTDNDKYVVQNNPFRFKGYYLDLDTKLYYCQTRYYYPVIYQWLSPDKFEYLDYEKVNGLNLYCYCFNNPVSFVDVNGNTPLTIFLIILLGSLITVTLLAVETPNAETTGPSFEAPSIGTVSEDGLTIFSVGGNLGRKDWYLDESKERSIYFSGFNLGASIEISKDMKSEKDLFSVDCSIFKFGYDGKYIDLNLALGPTQEFINVDIVAIVRDIKELFKK